MKWLKIIRKYYEYVLTKLKVLREQRIFRFEDVNVKYMYKPVRDCKMLTVVFSACTRPGLSARYNYVKTLDGMQCNRLYILDDFGPDGRGSYYLGRMPEFKEQSAVLALIQKIIDDTAPQGLIFCGSCKGAYAALNFGSRFKNAIMIIGEPTYRIATEFCLAKDLMHYWMGDISKQNIEYIDTYLENQLKNNLFIGSQIIHLFYSTKDEYYEKHTKQLLNNIQEYGYKYELETAEFGIHAELGLYFPDFLKANIKKYL